MKKASEGLKKMLKRPGLPHFIDFSISICHTITHHLKITVLNIHVGLSIMWEMSSISSSRSPKRTQLSSEAQTLLLISASHFSKKELSSSHAGWTLGKASL